MFRRAAFVAILTIASSSLAHAGMPEGDGWRSLFNGKDLTGWKAPEGDGGHWKVVDGVIDYDARSEAKGDKNLWTGRPFGDFELQLDWRIKETHGKYPMRVILPNGSYKPGEDGRPLTLLKPNADSGVFLRGMPKAQVNIWCWPVGSGEVWGFRNDQDQPDATRAACVPKVKADKPVGEWNTFRIKMVGEVLNVHLNGKHVIQDARLHGVNKTGPIALQHHGGFNEKTGEYNAASSLMQFRDIYIRLLDE